MEDQAIQTIIGAMIAGILGIGASYFQEWQRERKRFIFDITFGEFAGIPSNTYDVFMPINDPSYVRKGTTALTIANRGTNAHAVNQILIYSRGKVVDHLEEITIGNGDQILPITLNPGQSGLRLIEAIELLRRVQKKEPGLKAVETLSVTIVSSIGKEFKANFQSRNA